MKPHDIRIEIYRRRPEGVTVTSIARELEVTPQTVQAIINGHGVSRRIAKAVAKAIRKPLAVVFPRYAGEAKPSRKAA